MVSPNLCQEYLNTATFRILVLFLIKSSTFCYIDRLPTSSYTGVIHFKKWSGFFGPPCICVCRSVIDVAETECPHDDKHGSQ